MSLNIYYIFLLVAFLFEGVCAESAQSYWTVPNGDLADFKQTFKNQQTLPIAWDGWDSDWTEAYLDNLTVVDLWVTSFNYDQYRYSQLLHEEIDISQAGTYTWVININSTALAATAEYVLRFKPPLKTYNVSSGSLSSTGFIILPAASSTTTTSFTSSTSSTTSPTATSATIGSTGNTGLSSGAKAGIGVGCAIGVIAAGALLAFFLRRWKRKRSPTPADGPSMDYSQVPQESIYMSQQSDHAHQEHKSTASEGTTQVSELPSPRQVVELPAERYQI